MHRDSPSRRESPCGALGALARASKGFTLLEITIAVTLLMIITAVIVVSGSGSSDRRKFEYAVDRLETSLRMARADAANKVRRIRMEFDEETRLPTLLWEPSPIDAPEQFEPYKECSWRSRIPDDLIAITRCRTTGPDGTPVDESPTSLGDDTDERTMQTITFNTDGTSDSVLIEIESTRFGEDLRAAIKLDGENNIIKMKILGPPSEDEDENGDPFAEDEDEDNPFADNETDNTG